MKIKPQLLIDSQIDPTQLNIEFSEQSNRQINQELEARIEQDWSDYMRSDPNAWDGDTYRLENIEEIRKGSLNLKLSIIKFSKARGYKKLIEAGEFPPSQLTYPIGTGGPVVTSDDYYILGVRNTVDRAKGRKYGVIGGSLQRNELEVNDGFDIIKNMEKEVTEELGVPVEHIVRTILLGVAMMPSSHISIVCKTVLSIDRQEVLSWFDKESDAEMSSLMFLRREDFIDLLASHNPKYQLLTELL